MAPAALSAETFPPPMTAALLAACDAPLADPQKFRAALPDARILGHDVDLMGGQAGRTTTRLRLPDGLEVEIRLLFPGGRLRRVTIDAYADRPRASIDADAACRILEGKRIDYDDAGAAQTIRFFSADLKTQIRTFDLNPPAPPGADPGGITVGLIDSGVNYTIAPFKERLARDYAGGLVGRDFWDGDDLPFDADTGRNPFFPLHHGSTVMSVLIAEAPMARVIPVRYPRPDMTRMADAVAWLAGQGARIVNLAMGSNSRDEWQAFADAARKHPQMLFVVSAGNDGRDIDRQPVFPASLDLANSIVVTSSELDGRLARGSNWGTESVDIMVPGERIPVIDHRGAPGKASGSSYAVPRVTALAVRMLAKNPDWRGPEVRDAILKRARSLAGEKLTRYGWIPDPTDGP